MSQLMTDFKLLTEAVHLHAGSGFSGLGLILYEHLDELDYMHLNDHFEQSLPIAGWDKMLSTLLTVSDKDHTCHDGFHAIDSNGQLTHVSLYLAPPISSHGTPSERYGSRFHTARLSAMVPGILSATVISKNYGIKYFPSE